MKMGTIILENSAMIPPSFDDIECWLNFRKFLNSRFKLKKIVHHMAFELVVSFLIIATFINAIFLVYNVFTVAIVIDDVFVWIFVVELIIRIIAIGPENFFADRWNNLDTFLVFLGFIFFFIPVSHGASSLARMARIFRVGSLLRIISHSNYLNNFKFSFFDKIKNIFQVTLEIMPIILKFMPLFLFTFFFFGIIGMELFYNSYATQGSPKYNIYRQVASFENFIKTQFMMVQVMTEAGWSMIAYDHCWRNPQYFGYVMVYFCIMHIIITYIIATLIKGAFWEVYFTVDQIVSERDRKNKEEILKEEQYEARAKEIKQIEDMIKTREYINPNTILKR